MSLRVAVLLVFLVSIVCSAMKINRTPLVTDELVAKINSLPGNTWTATTKPGLRIDGATVEQIKNLLGVRRPIKKVLAPRVFTSAENLKVVPTSFDSATQWPNCPTITNIRDQSACGSCWAMGAAEAMSDRYCIGNIHTNLEISAANLMECCWYCGNGCNGGDPDSAWKYWVSTGLVSSSCQPYPFPKCEHHIPQEHYPPCPSATYPTPSCQSGSCSNASAQPTIYKGSSSYSLSGEDSFQREVMTNGPIEVAFDVYEDFLAYKSGVYIQTSEQLLGGHAVRLVGWGELNGVNYWKIANSWNTDWGMEGYFLIRRGTDECGIEDSGSAGLA